MSDASVLFSDFKESFTFSDYFIVDENGCPYEGNQEPEAQLENLPKRVIITQVWSVLQALSFILILNIVLNRASPQRKSKCRGRDHQCCL